MSKATYERHCIEEAKLLAEYHPNVVRAALPMLAALKRAEGYLSVKEPTSPVLAVIRAAIAKAEVAP